MTADSPAIASAGPAGKPLPKWAIGLASISAALIILGGIGGVFGITWLQKTSLQTIDPQYIAATVKNIGDFPLDPKTGLDGYLPVWAISLPGLEGVNFSQGQGKGQLSIFSYLSPESDPDAREAIDFMYDKPGLFPAIDSRFTSIADKGKVDVNGHDFHYQTGQLKEIERSGQKSSGEIHKSLLGCLIKGRKVVVVEAYAPVGQSIDIDSVTAFLRKGQSF